MEPSKPSPAGLSRRSLIGATGAGAVLLALGGLGLGLQPGVLREPRRPLHVLDATTFSVLAAIADRICPGGDGLPTPWAIEVPESIDLFLQASHPGVGDELKQGLLFVENALPALFLERRLRPFTTLDPAGQDAVLLAFATSNIALRRTIYKALVGLVTATYWGDSRVYGASGYVPLDFG